MELVCIGQENVLPSLRILLGWPGGEAKLSMVWSMFLYSGFYFSCFLWLEPRGMGTDGLSAAEGARDELKFYLYA